MRTDDKLPQVKGRPTDLARPRMTRTRRWLLGSTLAVYAATVIGVLTTSWLVQFDWQVMLFRPYKHWPEIHTFLDYFVVMGQRGPTAVAVTAWMGWCCYKQRTLRPLIVLGTSLLLLNITVGSVKLGFGRLGPHYATTVGSNEMWGNGDIFPSGHTANAVVTWGVLAYLATTPRARRVASVIAAVFAFGVGMTTVYLGTHWVSDVVLGWAAGVLVLLALPWLEPAMARAEALLLALYDKVRERRASAPLPVTRPVAASTLATPRAARDDELPARETVSVGGRPSGVAAHMPEARPHHPLRTHPIRSERGVTPGGSRRPPHADRLPRATAPLGPPAGRGRAASTGG
ncbi:phosphatase PAP2 family protein [Streptomyces sp. ME19-01-6]|uniref:phosphatase PAP2 family protein n=1 Tax=Streptomyces sp. ME19-01-6 TaxID=3028686 RepID=UPI0029B8FF2C|nr:phosphatase PAP2 family protein [Streptomyces sp. ME19-01-6]MDX3231557.1 phosphatase PAP2 family protein [Streptomyces sp. ME19-01-6]